MNQEETKIYIKKLRTRQWVTFIICIVLIATNIATALVAIKVKKDLKGNDYPLIDPARNFTSQEDFIVNIQPLREFLRDLVDKESSTISTSIYIEQLNTGANININQDLRLWPASLTKLPLGMAVMKKVELGKWSMEDRLVYMKVDADKGSGNLYTQPFGTTFTIEELLKELLINSDNTASNMLERNMTGSDLKTVIEEIGLEELFTEEGKITAKEYTRLWRSLYTSSFLKRSNSQMLLEWLSQQPFSQHLSQGVPKGIIFAHKWGENDRFNIYADSGIVYARNRPYMITVVLQGKQTSFLDNQAKARELMRIISQKAYETATQ